MATEIHALILGFDQTYATRDLLTELIGRKVEITGFVDSKTLFDVVTKDGTTTKKGLLIDICALKESYDRGELKRLSWLPGKETPADALTKPFMTLQSPLWHIMTTNQFKPEPIGCAIKSAPAGKNH